MTRIFSIAAILFVLAAGTLFFFQDKENSKTASVISNGPNLEERREFFAAKVISESLQDLVDATDDSYVALTKETCTGENATNFMCYDNLYAAIVREEGIEESFAFLRKEYQDNAYVETQCHQITHVIGKAAVEKFPSVSEAYGVGDSFCWSGYYHGVIEAVIADIGYVNLDNNLDSICDDIKGERKYSFDHYNCVHGLGHGIMVLNQNELFESLAQCDILKEYWDAASCWSGAFMENIMTDYRNHFTAYLKTEDLLYPCNAVNAQYKKTCYLMQTSYMLKVNNQNFKETFSLCKKADEGFEDICYQSLGRDAASFYVNNAQGTTNLCLLGENFEQQSNCVIGAVKDFISYFHGDEEAKYFCSLFEENLNEVCSVTAKEYGKVL